MVNLMNIREERKILLKIHADLYNRLILIPTQRELEYREDVENGNIIGRPRFKQKEFDWSPKLLINLHNHLQNIYLYFEKYYFWYDDILVPLIDKRFRVLLGIFYMILNIKFN